MSRPLLLSCEAISMAYGTRSLFDDLSFGLFEGDQAVKEAIADGKPRSEAQYLTTWVRNVNPRLRTLPLASGVVVKLWDSCEENGSGHNLLTMLSANASQKGTYYYTLTVSHGKVQRIQEQLAINAC